jgi:hypothetical protein
MEDQMRCVYICGRKYPVGEDRYFYLLHTSRLSTLYVSPSDISVDTRESGYLPQVQHKRVAYTADVTTTVYRKVKLKLKSCQYCHSVILKYGV